MDVRNYVNILALIYIYTLRQSNASGGLKQSCKSTYSFFVTCNFIHVDLMILFQSSYSYRIKPVLLRNFFGHVGNIL